MLCLGSADAAHFAALGESELTCPQLQSNQFFVLGEGRHEILRMD